MSKRAMLEVKNNDPIGTLRDFFRDLLEKKVVDAMNKGFFDQALVDIASLRVVVDAFFDEVMVLAEDKQVRRNRLALLGCITELFGKFADFSKLST